MKQKSKLDKMVQKAPNTKSPKKRPNPPQLVEPAYQKPKSKSPKKGK